MKRKTQLKNKIKDLGKHLKTPVAQDALKTLLAELAEMKDDDEVQSGLPLPKELGAKQTVGLFSDGACRGNPGPGAFAFIIQQKADEVLFDGAECFEKTTNNRMELSGVIEGLKCLRTQMGTSSKIFVYTDSKYVVDGINKWVDGWKSRGWKKADKKEPENLELWKQLDELKIALKPAFLWVKGHAGHPQNELVDQMANELLDENGY